ncbi:MAG: Penicillin-binding protein 2 [Candidatus Daviesbacteria bacterium GW2011_GWB1_41_5]|uniref:Penicillin-binding protein 2 n=1 Tax=Candidatus Daviesbacteria bacterium GW2011_GWB1_41_5 TaxID=1618429 RepID=A0A0G0WGP8_9BACT|nr:MAG: Penicillin-binding protein 2 [Candidatus Daviesbacteria bacterium GW2011_GWB1_41_5]
MSFNKYKIKKSYGDIETHEVFLDKLAKTKEEELGISEKKLEVPLKEKISYILLGIFLLLAISLFLKTFYFQIVEGKKLYIASENNKGLATLVIPERGIIYDSNLKKLVSNSPAFDLVCDRRYFSISSEAVAKKIKDIAKTIGKNADQLKKEIESSNAPEFLVSENISHDNLLVLETKIKEFTGCKIQQNTERNYLYGPVFSHILGYTGRINKDEYSSFSGYAINDYIGKTGLERYYEAYLRGRPGQTRELKNASGAEEGVKIISQPQAGDNLVLNINADLQDRVYQALEKSIKNVGAKKGAAVAMDPQTGAVLALVSYPSYDDNLFSGGISQEDFDKIQNDPSEPLFNRAVSAQYPTGSTIKPFEASAALQEKIISPDKQINDPGYILVHNQYDPSIVYRYGGVQPHGWVDMRKALAVSSNIYFYTVGGGYEGQEGLGPTRIKKYLSLFGWSQKTGIDLPSEFSGFIPDPEWKKKTKGEGWWDGDTYNLSIGQSDLQTTPLQVASAYSAIANGGTLYKPQIINKIISADNAKTIKKFSPEIIRSNFIDAENLKIVREGMRDGVTEPYGLSAYLNDLPVLVAAKTGTAEIGYQNRFNVWSSVFAPYENPEIVLVVTVEEVQGLGAVTLPVAKDVLNWYFTKK